MSQDVTNAELFRLLTLTRQEHGERLEAILEQTMETNGRVTRLEEREIAHASDLKELKAARIVVPVAAPVNDDGSPGITKRDLKVLGAVIVVIDAVLRWGPAAVRALGGGQ